MCFFRITISCKVIFIINKTIILNLKYKQQQQHNNTNYYYEHLMTNYYLLINKTIIIHRIKTTLLQ